MLTHMLSFVCGMNFVSIKEQAMNLHDRVADSKHIFFFLVKEQKNQFIIYDHRIY